MTPTLGYHNPVTDQTLVTEGMAHAMTRALRIRNRISVNRIKRSWEVKCRSEQECRWKWESNSEGGKEGNGTGEKQDSIRMSVGEHATSARAWVVAQACAWSMGGCTSVCMSIGGCTSKRMSMGGHTSV